MVRNTGIFVSVRVRAENLINFSVFAENLTIFSRENAKNLTIFSVFAENIG